MSFLRSGPGSLDIWGHSPDGGPVGIPIPGPGGSSAGQARVAWQCFIGRWSGDAVLSGSSSVSRQDSPHRRYLRIATAITSHGNPKPANTENETGAVTGQVSSPRSVSTTARREGPRARAK